MSGDDFVGRQMQRALRIRAAVTTSLLATVGSLAQADSILEPHRWQDRILLVYASDHHDESLMKTNGMIAANASGFAERDLVVATVLATEGRLGDRPLSEEERLELRRRYHVEPDGFTVILVGKDGGEKLRWRRPPDAAELFELIDSMPMRQEEMRRGQPRSTT